MMSTISKPKMINEVISRFVIKALSTIIREPDYEYLNKMIQAQYLMNINLT